jgi:hypothetical protein
MRSSGWKPSSRWKSWAPASPWPATTWKFAAPASCWARTSRARSRRSAFALYSDLLNRAVEAFKNGEEPDLDEPLSITSEVDMHITAMIPDSYLPDVHQRLVLYKRISQADTDKKRSTTCRSR